MSETFAKGLLFCGMVIVFVALMAGFVALQAWIFMLFWNIISPVFTGPLLTFYQAIAAVVVLNMVGGAFKATVSSGKGK